MISDETVINLYFDWNHIEGGFIGPSALRKDDGNTLTDMQ